MYKNQAEYCVAKKAKVRSYDYFDILLGNWDDIVVVRLDDILLFIIMMIKSGYYTLHTMWLILY